MKRLDPVNATVWGAMAFFVAAFWIWVASMLIPSTADWLRAAGSLNACVERGLTGAECSEYARGR